MERLTYRDEKGNPHSEHIMWDIINRLAEYEDAEEQSNKAEQTDMDKLTTDMMEHICDNLCKHPIRVGQTQDELEDICAECKMGKFVCDILNTYNHQAKILAEIMENSLDPIEMCKVKIALDKLKEYKNLEEQGLLLIPQCGEGDTLYEIHPLTGRITERLITYVRIIRSPNFTILYESGAYPIIEDCIGKTVFLTEQEAQSALEKMKGE